MKSKISTGYLTPQGAKRKKADAPRYSETNNIGQLGNITDGVFEKLMSCPIKKKLILELIASEKDNIENYKKQLKDKQQRGQSGSPFQKLQKKQQLESPTALHRRRALEQQNQSSPTLRTVMESPIHSRQVSSISRASETSSSNPSPVLFDKLLDGVVAFVEVKTKGQDRSNGVKALMISMGANVKDSFTREVTHVIFKVNTKNIL